MNFTTFVTYASIILVISAVFYSIWVAIQNALIKKMARNGVILEVVLEKDSDKDPFQIEQLWSSFHGLYLPWYRRLFKPQPYLSFEIKSEADTYNKKKEITFNIWVPEGYEQFIRRILQGQYPNAQIIKLASDKDYIPSPNSKKRITETAELGLMEHSAFSIKTFKDFEADPLQSITSSLTELDNKELAVIQILARPLSDSWRQKAKRVLEHYERTNKMPRHHAEWTNFVFGFLKVFFVIVEEFIHGIFSVGKPLEPKSSSPSKSSADSQNQKEMLEKVLRHPFAFQIRILVASPYVREEAKKRVDAITASFKELDGPNNRFKREYLIRKNLVHERMKLRYFSCLDNDDVLSTVELAGFCHLPNKNIATPGIKRIQSKQAANPTDVSLENAFAKGNFRGNDTLIGLDENARMRHVYVAGMTGVGKSVLLENMIINDIENGRGCVVIDPHGELVDTIMEKISSKRSDIYLLDPSDIAYPFGMNLLELTSNDEIRREMEKILVVDSYITVMKRVFGSGAIGPNTDDLFRMSCSAILEHPEGGGLLEMLLMMTSDAYRARVIPYIKDPIVKNYWVQIFPSLTQNKNFAVQNLNAPLNKIRRFIANPLVANIICQRKSTLNIADAINSGAVILARFSRGDMGFENSALLGAMLIAKVQIAAMQRVSIPMEQRVPTYLYVDEFQNFVGDSSGSRTFAEILSEARKYKLGLVIAHQYIDQLRQGGDNFLLSAIFNNCGTTITFRVGATDAKFYEQVYYDPDTNTGFKATDIANADKYQIILRIMTTSGVQSQPFTATTLPPAATSSFANPDAIRKRSRAKICVPRKVVQQSIEERTKEDKIIDAN